MVLPFVWRPAETTCIKRCSQGFSVKLNNQQFVEGPAPVIAGATALAKAGVSLHWLHPKSKRPIGEDWSAKPFNTPEMLRASYREGNNTGIRLGEPSKIGELFLHVIDLDIRKAETTFAALEKLRELCPEVDSLPFVISGSGGASRHFYFLSDQAFRSKKLAHSGEKYTDAEGKKHWTYEIELFGTGKQVACPPSIHPDTGKPYVWGREIDFDLVDMGCGPEIASSRIAEWTGSAGATSPGLTLDPDDDEDLLSYTRRQPLGLSDEEVKEVLRDLPQADYCEDRDGWLQVGMALHHEFEGSDKGLQFWNAFSKKSDKFDAADQARVWASFRGRPTPVRMASLVKAAGIARLEEDHEGGAGFDDESAAADDELADLLGDTPAIDQDIADLLGEAGPPGPSAPGDKRWRERLDLNEAGNVKPTLHNLSLIIANDPRTRGLAQHNEFTDETVQRGSPGVLQMINPGPKGTVQLTGPIWKVQDRTNGDLWTDGKDIAIRNLIEAPKRQGGYGVKVSDRDLRGAVDIAARGLAFHPVREYLSKTVWDGKPRAEALFTRFLGTPDGAYTRAAARTMLVGAVARAYEPGHKFDFVVILEGSQGKRKSTFIRVLAKNWFAELSGSFDNRKELVETMQGSWILEVAELQGFDRSEVLAIKAVLSSKEDKVRLSYGRRSQVFKRQCIFIGSTNDSEYLRDETGGRRFWPIRCTVDEIDTGALSREVDQIWAEAKHLYDAMRNAQPRGELPLYLTAAEAQAEAKLLQETRRAETAVDSLAGRIEGWLDRPPVDDCGFDDDDAGRAPRSETCLTELWVDALGNDPRSYGQREAQLLGRAMKQIPGWTMLSPRPTLKFGKQRIYRRESVTTFTSTMNAN